MPQIVEEINLGLVEINFIPLTNCRLSSTPTKSPDQTKSCIRTNLRTAVVKIFSKRLRWPAGLLIKVLVVGRHYWYVYVVQTDNEIVAMLSPNTDTPTHNIYVTKKSTTVFVSSCLARLARPRAR